MGWKTVSQLEALEAVLLQMDIRDQGPVELVVPGELARPRHIVETLLARILRSVVRLARTAEPAGFILVLLFLPADAHIQDLGLRRVFVGQRHVIIMFVPVTVVHQRHRACMNAREDNALIC